MILYGFCQPQTEKHIFLVGFRVCSLDHSDCKFPGPYRRFCFPLKWNEVSRSSPDRTSGKAPGGLSNPFSQGITPFGAVCCRTDCNAQRMSCLKTPNSMYRVMAFCTSSGPLLCLLLVPLYPFSLISPINPKPQIQCTHDPRAVRPSRLAGMPRGDRIRLRRGDKGYKGSKGFRTSRNFKGCSGDLEFKVSLVLREVVKE